MLFLYVHFILQGAVPATVAVLKGQVHVGLSHDQLRDLAAEKKCIKISRRDFPYVLAKVCLNGFVFVDVFKKICIR